MTDKIVTCIWFDKGQAGKAAEFYMSLGLPHSHIDTVHTSPVNNPSTQQDEELLVNFTLGGRAFMGLNGGPVFPQTEAVSFMVMTEDQAETDHLWHTIIDNRGRASECGWCKDRWGVNWQITPRRLMAFFNDPNPARSKAAFEAMMTMQKIDIKTLEAAADAAAREIS